MGKTAKGTIWIDKNKTSPFEFFQYFYNRDDSEVEMLLTRLTDLSIERIIELMQGDIRETKKVMAYEITKRIHGKEDADNALNMANNLFSNNNYDDAPEFKVLDGCFNICDILVNCKFCASKGEARRLIMQGGISVNDNKLTDFNYSLNDADFKDGFALIKKGKKQFIKIIK